MPKTFRPYEPDQMLLLPPSVKEWVPDGDLAHVISDVVDVLDLCEIEAVYEDELRGYPPYNPRMMTKLWLYAYAVGIRSCRKLGQLVQRDVGFMMLAAGNQPDFRTLNSFRLRHLEALSGLFVQVVRLCEKKGLVKLRHVAVDGTRVKANASKHSAMSYGRMKQEEARIRAEVEAYFTECDRVDAEEDRLYGPDQRGDELPEELRTAERRRRAIKEAMAELEREAKEAGKEAPEEKAQRNFTDPESRIMKGSEGAFIQGYNAQAAVDASSQVIVAASLTTSAADAGQLVPIVDLIRDHLGVTPQQVSADAGYCSETNLEALEQRGVDAYVATGRMSRSYRCPPAPRGRIPRGLSRRELMKRRLMTKRGRATYRLRQQVVEPVFGQIRNKGLIRLWLRGEAKARGEWLLHCIGHNLCKLQAVWA
ncbi:MAG: IS1182 family transposase [Candidatus Dormibacteraeota bacterium]|jgi:transposase|nr:IS1182 family transposase [Candidatus Dormibacteraeota bacterium]